MVKPSIIIYLLFWYTIYHHFPNQWEKDIYGSTLRLLTCPRGDVVTGDWLFQRKTMRHLKGRWVGTDLWWFHNVLYIVILE